MSHVIKGVNDLKTCRPDLLKEWDYELNKDITPDEVAVGGEKRVWWKCDNGHSYLMIVGNKSRGANCPYCSGKVFKTGINDLQTKAPELAAQWDYDENDGLTPNDVYWRTHRRIAWKCEKGHKWSVSPDSRIRSNSNCPFCSNRRYLKGYNDLKTRDPELAEEWNYKRNKGLLPEDVVANSLKKVWWKCPICGMEWMASISNRFTNESGCPKCMKHKRTSFPEQAIFYYLVNYFKDAENSYTSKDFDDRMELDIFIPSKKIAIEYDGIAFHTGEKSRTRDSKKYDTCKRKGIALIRVSEFDPGKEVFCDVIIIREGHTFASLDKAIIELLTCLEIPNVNVNTEKDRTSILKQYITIIKAKSIAAKYPEAVSEWDIEKNNGLTPDMVSANSNELFWWKCEEGHSYKAAPASHLPHNQGCPYCSNHRLLKGFNDLQTRHPDIAAKWDYERNSPLTPSDIICGAMKKYYWKCEKGHSYSASPNYKVYGSDTCPYCANTKILPGFNDVATVHPGVIKKWCYEKNGKKPTEYLSNSHAIVWWECDKGHTWKRAINAEINYDGCPVCSEQVLAKGENDIATLYLDIASEWNYERNEKGPENYTRKSKTRVWWKCNDCGYEWQAVIYNRIMNHTGCPKCGYSKKMHETYKQTMIQRGHTLAKEYPELLQEWDYEKNTLNPEEITPGANVKVWWKCKEGHSYQAWLNDRSGKRKTGCPYCAGKRKIVKEDNN